MKLKRKKIIVFALFLMMIIVLGIIGLFVIGNDRSIHNVADTTVEQKDEIQSENDLTDNNDPTDNSDRIKDAEEETVGQLTEKDGQVDVPETDHSSLPDVGKGHYETRTVVIKEAYDEQILISKGSCTDALIKDAWDEEVWEEGSWFGSDAVDVKVCNGCGQIFYGSISEHMSDYPEHGGWHNESIAQGEPYWHGTKKTIHHDAIYETQCTPDEYETVHHDAVYATETVWVND